MAEKSLLKINTTLDQCLLNLGLLDKVNENRLFLCWPQLVGKVISSRCQPQKLVGKTLLLSLEDNNWLEALNYIKQDIIEKINKALDKEVVTDIKLLEDKMP